MAKRKSGKPKEAKLVTLPKGGVVYRYKFEVARVRFAGSTGLADYDAAHAWALKLKQQEQARAKLRKIAAGANPIAARDLPLLFVAEEFWRLKLSRTVNAEADKTTLFRVVEMLGERTMISTINDYVMLDFVGRLLTEVAARTGKPYKPRTINTFVIMVRRLHNFAGNGPRGKLKLPLEAINWEDLYQQADQRIRTITASEERRLFAGREDYAVVGRFGLVCGLRRTNLIELKWSEVYLEEREIRLIQKRSRKHKEVRPHVIHITDWMLATLQAQLPHKEAGQGQVWTIVNDRTQYNAKAKRHFVAGQRTPMRVWGFHAWFKARAKKLGLDIIIHDIRRSTGSRILSTTGSIAFAQKVLGHADPSITARVYAHCLPGDLRAAMDQTQRAFAS